MTFGLTSLLIVLQKSNGIHFGLLKCECDCLERMSGFFFVLMVLLKHHCARIVLIVVLIHHVDPRAQSACDRYAQSSR